VQEHILAPALSATTIECNPEVLNAKIDDLISISDLNEMSILHNLRIRYRQDLIYTSVSSILIAVNPFKQLPLYTPEITDRYRQGPRGLPPHAYGIGYNAYNGMLADGTDQSVVISGESGAGKSETTKVILQFLTDLSSVGEGSSATATQILAANPILEAFGNAKTLRNNNSSRFGKLITVNFDSNGGITGGGIINYLLEKSRVVGQTQGERNYHIFYQLLAAGDADPELQERLKLQDPELFSLTGQSGCIHVEGISDEKDFEELMEALTVVHFSDDEKETILRIVAGVLHFGNVKFSAEKRANEEDAAVISNREAVEFASKLWGVDPVFASRSLLAKNIGTKSIVMVRYNHAQANDARDAMIKRVYAELFQFVVNKINGALSEGQKKRSNFIGVLDIFGFESFVTNSFEQLCINFCNEKLQFHFNEHIFRMEQALYEAEGVPISCTDFKDNKPALELMEAKATGIFSMCDEEISVPRGSDDGMLTKIFQRHGDKKHPNCVRPKPKECLNSQNCFGVLHYAGPVFYDVSGFLDKNRDQVHADIIGCLQSSTSDMIKGFFANDMSAASNRGSLPRGKAERPKTLGGQFKTQLADLINTLNATTPHFVRCIKPNDNREGNSFVCSRIQDQLRYAGLLEVCRIRKLGFPDRREFSVFYKRYRCCDQSAGDLDALLASLTAKGVLKTNEWAKGNSRVFLRTSQALMLETAREEAFLVVVQAVQKVARGMISRHRFKNWLKLLQGLKDAIAQRVEKNVKIAMDLTFELPWGGKHLQIIKDAKVLLARLMEENRALALVQAAVKKRDLNGLRSAIAAAGKMSPVFTHPEIAEAEVMVARLQAELEIKAALAKAISSKNRGELEALLGKAEAMGLDCDEVKQATALKARMMEEDRLLAALKVAAANKDVDALIECLDKCASMGLENADVVAARKVQEKCMAEYQAIQAVVAAVESRMLNAVTSALDKATALGLGQGTAEIAKGMAVKEQLLQEKAAGAELKKAVDGRLLAGLEKAIAAAMALGLKEDSNDSLHAAVVMRGTLVVEARVRSSLVGATASANETELNDALAEAGRLGLRGADVDKAREAAKKFGARNATRDQLATAAEGDSVEAIDAALEAAKSQNMMSSPEAANALAKRGRLQEQRQMIIQLNDMVQTSKIATLHSLTRMLADCGRMDLGEVHPAEMAAANARVLQLEGEKEARDAMDSAFESSDLAELNKLVSAAQESKFGESSTYGEEKKVLLGKKAALLAELDVAMEAKDKRGVQQLLAQADSLQLTGEKFRLARLFANREQLIEKTLGQLREAEKTWNLRLLNEALSSAIELGLQTHEVTNAEQLRTVLLVVEDIRSRLQSAVKVVAIKLSTGLVGSDLQPLIDAIEEAQRLQQIPPKWQPLIDADEALVVYRGHVTARIALINSLASKSASAIQSGLADCENLNMEIPEIAIAKTYLKNAGLSTTPTVTGDSGIGYEEAEKARKQRKETVRQARFELKHFSGLRSADDFAKGILLQKQKVKDHFLMFQKDVINRSLTEMSKELTKVALQLHKDLLGYMGDKQMPFPAMLAQDVLQKGYAVPGLRDEIYIQLIKQLTNNPRAESVAKGWQMLCMCVATFAPSPDFENFLMHYIVNKMENGRGAIVDYAKYCLRSLEGILASGESCGFVPSAEEIQAYKDRPPVLASIELVDGQVIAEDLPVTPDLNVGKVLEITFGWMNLTDPRMASLGIFVYDLGELVEANPGRRESIVLQPERRSSIAPHNMDLVRTPRPLRNEDFMGDVVIQKARQKRNFKFVLKKKVFLPTHCVRGFHGLVDPFYERLVYLQAEDDFILNGDLEPETEEQATVLATSSLIVAFGEETPNSVEGLIDNNVVDFVPPAYRNKYSHGDWGRKILKVRNTLMDKTPEDIQWAFVQIAQEHQFYGMHWFYVHKASDSIPQFSHYPRDLILGFNYKGMHIFDLAKNSLHAFNYADIFRWGGSSNQFSLILSVDDSEDAFEMTVSTTQAADMAAIILDMIHAIMAQEEGEEEEEEA
jgi:myosin heavy subunit